MKRHHFVIVLIVLVAADTMLAVYVFDYSTDVLEPSISEFSGITVLDRSLNGVVTIGTEDGRIITPAFTYQNEARITSLLTADDGQFVVFADGMNRVHLYLAAVDLLIWTRSFDGPVHVVEVWVRPGFLFLEPTYILVREEGGFLLLRGFDGATAWSYASDAPFVMQAAEGGKIIVGFGSRVNFFWLGDSEPYRWIPVEGPVVDLLADARGLTLLLLRPGEVMLYDGITGEVLWRKSTGTETQAALSWDGEKSFLLSDGRLDIISKSGQTLLSQDVGMGRLMAPDTSSYYFVLRNDRIDAYQRTRPAPVWTAHLASAYEVHATSDGTLIHAWTSDRLFILENTEPFVASRPWVGVFGTIIVVQVFVLSLSVLVVHAPPSVGDLAIALLIGVLVGVISLLWGSLVGFVELEVVGAFIAVVAAATTAAFVGRRSGGALAGSSIGLAIGVIGFLAASILIAFYRYVFEILPTFPAVEVAIRSLTLGWLLGLAAGFLGGLSASVAPGVLRSGFSRT